MLACSFLLLIFVSIILACLSQDDLCWIKCCHQEQSDKYKVHSDHMRTFSDLKAFNQNKHKILGNYMTDTRKRFTTQYFIGTVMKDGHHIMLPPDSKWVGHTIETGEHIKEDILENALPIQQVPPS